MACFEVIYWENQMINNRYSIFNVHWSADDTSMIIGGEGTTVFLFK